MATVHTNLTVGKTYAVTSADGCTVTLANGVEVELQAGQDYFTPDTPEVVVSDDDATVVQVFNHAPGRRGSGGNIDSDLNVGHGAADAVAAVCTLTLGDLGTGGTLEDSNGQSVELEAPQAYATGSVDIADAAAAGTITFGTHGAIEFDADLGAKASGSFLNYGDAVDVNGVEVAPPADTTSVEGWNAAFETAGVGLVCTAVEHEGGPEYTVHVEAAEYGVQGNAISITNSFGAVVTLEGGQDARTAQEVVDALNASEDCPAVATLDTDGQGITFTAKELGVNDTITITGGLFSDAVGMSGGHGDYTIAELVTAIEGEFEDITPAAGEAEGTITLTATTAGKAANAVVYTSTGCFGGETVKQGSTTRGKDAVTQTAFKIYLNGEELDVETAPVPEPLGTTTELLHGHVYTLAVAADTDLSALGVELYGTAELWVDYTAGSVTWPALWSWVDGIVPTFTAGTRYFVRVWSDGYAVIAKLEYSYTNV